MPLGAREKDVSVQLEPKTEGKWRWTSDRQLSFVPARDWLPGTRYRVRLTPATVAPHIRLERDVVETTTPALSGRLTEIEFYQDLTNPITKQVTATLEFTHPVDRAGVEKRLRLHLIGRGVDQPFTVTYGLHDRLVYLRSAPLTLPEREDFMKLTLAAGVPDRGGNSATEGAVEGKVRVPDLFSFFKIESAAAQIVRTKEGEPQQILVITTTALARSEEMARDLRLMALPARPASPHEDEGDEAGDDPEEGGENARRWKSPREIDAQTLARATAIDLTPVPSAEEASKIHTFRFQHEQEGDLYVKINRGARALGDFQLARDYDEVLPVPPFPREVIIQGEGGILALSGERKISIQSRGVAAIDFEIARVGVNQINHLVSQTEGRFQHPDFVSGLFDEENIARLISERQPVALANQFQLNYSAFDFSPHLQPGVHERGLFFLKVRGWDTARDKPIRGCQDGRFLLVTDLGLLAKKNADESREVFVLSLRKGTPLADVQIELLGKNGIPLATARTGPEGRVSFPSTRGMERERTPVAFVARLGEDVAFLPYDRSDRQVNLSRFDIGGVESVSGEELDAFLFTERGVYRPGDNVHLGLIVKRRDWLPAPAGLPLEVEIVDPRGQVVRLEKITLPEAGLTELGHQTVHASASGIHTASVYLVQRGRRQLLLGSTVFHVKEFQPDRMKITSTLSADASGGWIAPEGVQTRVELRNLYGTAAPARRITARMDLAPAAFQFREFPGYVFFDNTRERPAPRFETVSLGDTKTDDAGQATIDLGLERFADATYSLALQVEGFEADNGRSVATTSRALVSSLAHVVGCKPDGDVTYIRADEPRALHFVALNRQLRQIELAPLQLNIIEQVYVSVLRRRDNGSFAYDSVLKERAVSSQEFGIPATGATFPLPTARPGNFLVELRDAAGSRISRLAFSVVGRGAVARSLERNAELEVKLSRENFAAGEEIEVSITAPYTGSGLITIERERVYAQQWFTTDKTSSLQRIRIPAEFEGTGYVNVSFVRALDSKEIFMNPLSCAVAPFTANREQRQLVLEIAADAQVRPGQPLAIRYRTDRPAKIVLFAVDEGILQVTDFKTPDPLGHFFRKQGLLVETSQIVDLIMPEFSLLRASAFGGGDGASRHLNPFRRVTEQPVVFWSGVVEADATERTVTYEVPDYFNGTLRLMAVAYSPTATAAAQKDTLVRGPFVVTPGVPTFAAPGDRFEIGVTVAAEEAAETTLALTTSKHLEIVSDASRQMSLARGGEETVRFILRATDKPGSATLTFRASTAAEESTVRATMSVRPAVPLTTRVRGGSFTGETKDVPVTRELMAENRRTEAALSALPLGLARGLDQYLSEYPHGCAEQVTSAAFCRLVLQDEVDFGLNRKEVSAQLERTFNLLRSRQSDQGGFGYWRAERNHGVDFVSVYVMHFLLEAKAAGFPPPADVFRSGLGHLVRMAALEPRDLPEARTVAYAIWLLTRENVITTNYILNLRDTLERRFSRQWEKDLAGVYLAGALSLLQETAAAEKLIAAYRMRSEPGALDSDFYQSLGMNAQYVAVLARHFPERMRALTPKELESITAPIGEGHFNTLSAAYAVVALKEYSRLVAARPPALALAEVNRAGEIRSAGRGRVAAQARAVFTGRGRSSFSRAEPWPPLLLSSGGDRLRPRGAPGFCGERN